MAVHPDVPATSLQEFIRLARQRPGQLNYASSGSGGASHLGIEKFKRLTQTHIVHIPYRGAGPALTDAVAGQVQLSMWTPLAIAPHVAAGRLRALAITGTKRLPIPSMANVPTFAEAGLPAFDHRAWQALYAPAATPRAVVERLHAEVRKMLTNPKVLDTLDRQGVDPFLSELDQVPAYLRTEQAEIARLVKAANIKMD
jgi:tripartite-type tricarboxylate transporter receptor subunit TctC